MLTVKLGKIDVNLIKLDRFIRKKIPNDNDVYNEEQKFNVDVTKLRCYEFIKNKSHINKSMGTLGGGNHFIEIDKDDENNLYLVIHSGSRNLGKQVCEYYTKVAKEEYLKNKEKNYKALIKRYKKLNKEYKIEEGLNKLKEKYNSINFDLVPLEGKAFNDYMFDMDISQKFAYENRERMAYKILEFLELNLNDFEYFHTIHNYINMEDKILRKGSISAYENEEILIPINMRDGSILAKGKSNEDYNFSAPHGAGRIFSRKEAREIVTLEDFKKSMEGIYSTSVQVDTLDESPFAYKSINDIIPNILPTVEIVKILKPIYNFKACKNRSR